MNFEAIKNILETEAKLLDIKEYDIFYVCSEGISAETLKDEIASFSSGVEGGVNFRCIVNGHIGCAGTQLLEESEIRSLVRRAASNAALIENDEKGIIFGGSESYPELPALDFNMPSVAEVKDFALKMQKELYACSEHITDGTCTGRNASSFEMKLYNSKGLDLSYKGAWEMCYAQAVVNVDGESVEGFEFVADCSDKQLTEIPKKATEQAMAKIGAGSVDSGKYKIIIDGKQMRSMLSAFAGVFSGKNALLGLSLLADKVGEKIAADCVSIVDDPLCEWNPMKMSFDGEGVATYKKNVVERGVLKTLLYDLATAERAGVNTTGNGQRTSYAAQVNIRPFAFYIEAGELSDSELLEKMSDGIYITELKGLHAGLDSVTGDFSLESAGFLVKDGKKADAVKGFTVAGNFFDLLKNVVAVSSEMKHGGGGSTCFASPDILLPEMSVAGK